MALLIAPNFVTVAVQYSGGTVQYSTVEVQYSQQQSPQHAEWLLTAQLASSTSSSLGKIVNYLNLLLINSRL